MEVRSGEMEVRSGEMEVRSRGMSYNIIQAYHSTTSD